MYQLITNFFVTQNYFLILDKFLKTMKVKVVIDFGDTTIDLAKELLYAAFPGGDRISDPLAPLIESVAVDNAPILPVNEEYSSEAPVVTPVVEGAETHEIIETEPKVIDSATAFDPTDVEDLPPTDGSDEEFATV